MGFIRGLLFVLLLVFASFSYGQTPGSMTGFGDAINYRSGATELTEAQKDQMQREGQRQALKDAGYSDKQIDAYNKKIEDRKNAYNQSKSWKNAPALTDEEKKMGKIAAEARKKVNGQINKKNEELKEKNQSVVDKVRERFNDMNMNKVDDTMNEAGRYLVMAGTTIATAPFVGLPLAVVAALQAGRLYNLAFGSTPSHFQTILQSFASIGGGSWFSKPFEMIYHAINELIVLFNVGMQGTLVNLLGLLMAFYILFTVMKAIVSFQPIEPVKLISDVFFPVGRCIIAVLLIKYWQQVFDMVISPLLGLAIGFGNRIQSTYTSFESYQANVQNGVQFVSYQCTVNGSEQGLSVDVCNSILGFLASISLSLIQWMAFGATLIADALGQNIVTSFKMMVTGLMIFVFTFMVYVSFPMKLLDAMFRLMFVVALFPVWCVCWVLPFTRDYFKKAVSMFLNVLFTFLCASIVLVMVLGIVGNLFEGIPFAETRDLLMQGRAEEAMNRIGFSTLTLFYSACLLFMAYHLVSKVDYFTNIFAKQESLKIGEAMGNKTAALMRGGGAWSVGVAKNVGKWGYNKLKTAENNSLAKAYNESALGGKRRDGSPARQSPRVWSGLIPGIGLWDAHKAKKQIGQYGRTTDVVSRKPQKNPDGSVQGYLANATKDADGNVMARMKETNWVSADRSTGVKNRHRTAYDDEGNVRRTTDVKEDYDHGNLIRKTTTRTHADGSKTVFSVDAAGTAKKTVYERDGSIRSVSELHRDASHNRITTTRDASGRMLSHTVMDTVGNRTTTNYAADGRTVASTDTLSIDAATGSTTHTYEEAGGFRHQVIKDSTGDKTFEFKHNADGSETTDTYKPKVGGHVSGFIRESKDVSGAVTENFDVDLIHDEFFDIRGGGRVRMPEPWSVYSGRRP